MSEEEKNSIREQHTGGMKVMTENFTKLTNSKLGDSKPLVNEQVDGAETNENLGKLIQQGIKKATNIISPPVKLMSKNLGSSVSSAVPQTIKPLMAKFGTLKNTPYIQNLMRPLDNKIAILSSDINKLKPIRNAVTPQNNFLDYLKTNIEIIKRKIELPGGNVDLNHLYNEISGLKSYTSQKNIITQIDGALKEIEGLLTKIASR